MPITRLELFGGGLAASLVLLPLTTVLLPHDRLRLANDSTPASRPLVDGFLHPGHDEVHGGVEAGHNSSQHYWPPSQETVAVIIVGLLQVLVLRGQQKIMARQAEISDGQLKATERASRAALYVSLPIWRISLNRIPGSVDRRQVEAKNVGTSQAIVTRYVVRTDAVRIEDIPESAWGQPLNDIVVFGLNEPTEAPKEPFRFPTIIEYGRREIEGALTGDVPLYVAGAFDYWDYLGVQRRVAFCLQSSGPPAGSPYPEIGWRRSGGTTLNYHREIQTRD